MTTIHPNALIREALETTGTEEASLVDRESLQSMTTTVPENTTALSREALIRPDPAFKANFLFREMLLTSEKIRGNYIMREALQGQNAIQHPSVIKRETLYNQPNFYMAYMVQEVLYAPRVFIHRRRQAVVNKGN